MKTRQLLFSTTLLLTAFVLTGCSGGSGGSTTPPDAPPPTEVTISGRITYDRVPFDNTLAGGLDYANTQVAPARGVQVQLRGASNQFLGVAITDDNGAYSFTVDPDVLVRVRVFARLSKSDAPSWLVRVLDNTDNNAVYVLEGGLVSSGVADSVRDLHAQSGWDSALSAYTQPRAAAPFAILDSVYVALQALAAVDATFNLGGVDLFWSRLNKAADGDDADGEIGGTAYRDGAIYLVGDADNNTDEYDRSVIQHEFAHFIEDTLFRTDTIGGPHMIDEALDIRLAFAEGYANAFAGMVSGDPVYRDSFGSHQANDFHFSVEENPDPGAGDLAGWFVESSIHSILYDLFDENNDGVDAIALGLQPIYDVLSSMDYLTQSSRTSIFSFSEQLRSYPGVNASLVDSLLASQSITGTGIYGDGETNNGGFSGNLPIYKTLAVDGPAINVCSTDSLNMDEVNKLGNRQFVRFTPPSAQPYTLNVVGGVNSNPGIRLYLGDLVPIPDSAAVSDTLQVMPTLDAEEYVLEVFSRNNIDGDNLTGGDFCFAVSVSS